MPAFERALASEGLELEFTLESGELLLDVAGRFLWKQRVNSMGVPQLTRVELRGVGLVPVTSEAMILR